MSLSLVTAPTTEPFTVAEAKKQLKIEVTDDDSWIDDFLIPAVVDRAELATGRQIMQATWNLKLNAFPADYIEVQRPPLSSVTSITYVDTNGVTQTWADSKYQIDIPSGPRARRGRIMPAYNESWPTTRDQFNAVVVQFVCGYGTSGSSVPALVRMAMLLDLATLYEHREEPDRLVPLPRGSAVIYWGFRSHPRKRAA